MWEVVSGHRNITETSDTVDGLVSSTTYTYRVRAYGDGFVYSEEWGNPSSSDSATTHALPTPSKPTGLSATASGPRSIDVSWSQVSGARHYELQRSPNWQVVSSSIEDTSYPVTRLTPNTSYSFMVRAFGNGTTHTGWSDFSNEASATTQSLPAPAAPTDFTGTANGPHSITASWHPVTGARDYEFGIWISSWEDGSVSSTNATEDDVRVGDVILNPNTTYNIRVRAIGNNSTHAGESLYAWATVTTDPPPTPPAPDNFRVTNTAQYSITVSWNERDGIDKYHLQRKEGSGSWMDVSETILGSSTSKAVENLKCNTSYSFRLRAKGTGSTYSTDYGFWRETSSSSRTHTCPRMSAPRNLSAGSIEQESITVTWNRPSGVAASEIGSYKLDKREGTGSWGNVSSSISRSATSERVRFLDCNTSYSFRIYASGTGHPYSSTAYSDAEVTDDSTTTSKCDSPPTPGGFRVNVAEGITATEIPLR